jgi:UDP-N-acetylmuramoyl-L-alanyl-D-glutamate--2,6-diaminopimelate ligase
MTFRTGDIREALERAALLVAVRGVWPEHLTGITDDSRTVEPGGLFIAVRGSARDGHDFLPAVEDRAAGAIVERDVGTALPVLVVRDGRRAAAIAAAAAYGDPATGLRLLAVTGTSGKTTTVGMLRHLLDAETAPSASIGTLGVLLRGAGEPFPGGGGLTTPGPVELQRVLRQLADAGVRSVAMEVSSHSLDQRRVEGVAFDAAVFTNVSRDHLDYHGTMDAYVDAKARLLRQLGPRGAAVVNADDPAWSVLDGAPRMVRYGLTAESLDVTARDPRYGPEGSQWTLDAGGRRAEVSLPLMGDFNVLNALGAAAAGIAVGLGVEHVAARLSTLPQVPGRLERIHDQPTVLRDYSHKPDALARALDAVRPFAPRRLIVVFGCGGDRDRGKRPIMGHIAEEKADFTILTSDNPRTEDPEHILDEIEAGMTQRTHERIEDRRNAIARALDIAYPDDVIMLAGKGHETYQIRGTVSYPFDEREVVHELTEGAER